MKFPMTSKGYILAKSYLLGRADLTLGKTLFKDVDGHVIVALANYYFEKEEEEWKLKS